MDKNYKFRMTKTDPNYGEVKVYKRSEDEEMIAIINRHFAS
jgi:hypothetical protein